MKVILLGTGTSQGIPVIGCECDTCMSDNPKNSRTRTSALVSYNDSNVVIDTSTEFRLQMIRHRVKHLEAILFTHAHADHVHGLDDVRQFNKLQNSAIPCYGNHETVESIIGKYDYVFKPTQVGGGKPRINFHTVTGEFDLFGRNVIPLQVKHGVLDILGYRIGSFAYITDASYVPDETLDKLKGLKVLVINSLRYVPHSTHFSVGQAVEVVNKVNPLKTYLVHISHILEHERLERELPEDVHVGYDGMELSLD